MSGEADRTYRNWDETADPREYSSRLSRVAVEVAYACRHSLWRDRIDEITQVLKRNLAAADIDIFGLHLSDGQYQLESTTRPAAGVPSVELEPLDLDVLTTGRTEVNRAGVVTVPVLRDMNCVMIVRMVRPRPVERWSDLQRVLAPLASIHADRRSIKTLARLRTEFDYRRSPREFYETLGQAVLDASGVQFAALRVRRGIRLDCTAAWGFEVQPAYESLSWPADRFSEFARASNGSTVFCDDLQTDGSPGLAATPELKDVRAFAAIPIRIGVEIYGVLSLATSIRYHFAPVELDTFQSLANVVGLLIGNYQAPSGSNPSAPALNEFSLRATMDWIAHDARHVGSARIDNARQLVGELTRDEPTLRNSGTVRELTAILHDLSIVFDRYGMAVRSPNYKWSTESLLAVWNQAAAQFAPQARYLGISFSPVRDLRIGMYPEWIRAAFAQLIMNSIDAYNKRGYGLAPPSSKNRVISLSIDAVSTTDMRLVLHYSDNAGGINPAMVESPDDDVRQLPVKERIFRPRTSSKRGRSTGWGLPLVRTAIQEHHGSIELVDNSVRGVTFEITLPRVDEDQSGTVSNI